MNTEDKMTSPFNIILKVIFWLSLLFIVVAIYSLTLTQHINYEFADWEVRNEFYGVILFGLPVAVLLTLTGSIKKTNNMMQNTMVIGSSVLTSIIAFNLMTSMLFSVGFITFTNDTILYKHRYKKRVTISEQRIRYNGTIGFYKQRIVQIEPLLTFWNKVTPIDTATINRAEWTSFRR